MRTTWCLGALILSAALLAPAPAQQPGSAQAGQFFTGVNPRQINGVKVDPARAIRRSNMGKAMQSNAVQRTPSVFSMQGMFPRVSLGSWPPKLPNFSNSTAPPTKTSTVATGNVNLFNLNK